jgi:hypothetical protein
MNKLKKTFLLTFVLLFSLAGYAEAKNYWYSPLTAIAHATAGHPLKISVQEHHSPPSALRITADQTVEDGDPQWVLLGLTVPSGTLKHLKICYEVVTNSPGTTYISQVRLAEMTTPDSALVIHDDSTDLTDTSPTCYKSLINDERVNGTITLALRVVFGSTDDMILIGGIKLKVAR